MSSTPGNREVAHRVFAAEFDEAAFSYSESDEERAPNYVVMPTGGRVNRLFAVGVLTEVAPAGESILRARVVDPTGAFVVYAGQYQPEAMAFLESAETPSFVAVTGKARTFEPDDSDVVYTSVRPESINEVDAATRDRWTVTTAERTLDRVATIGAAIGMLDANPGLAPDGLQEALVSQGVDASLAAGIPVALREYDTGEAYLEGLQSVALDCLRQVAGDVDAVRDLAVAPADPDGSFSPVVDVGIDLEVDVPVDQDVDSAVDPAAEPEVDEPAETDAASGDPAGAPERSEPESASVDAAAESTESGGAASGSAPSGTAAPDADEPESVDASPSTDAGKSEAASTGSQPDEPAISDSVADTATADAPSDDGTADDGEPEDEAAEGGDEEFEMDEETRREVEEEYGVEFETAAEVDAPGEADIETSEPDAGESEPDAGESEPTFEAESAATDTAADADGEPEFEAVEPEHEETSRETPSDGDSSDEVADGEAPEADDADVESVLLSRMEALDDGDGAPRDELVESVSDATDAPVSRVEDAIQSLLMSGQCYEPEDDRFKPI